MRPRWPRVTVAAHFGINNAWQGMGGLGLVKSKFNVVPAWMGSEINMQSCWLSRCHRCRAVLAASCQRDMGHAYGLYLSEGRAMQAWSYTGRRKLGRCYGATKLLMSQLRCSYMPSGRHTH
jgi:hypothetical protein